MNLTPIKMVGKFNDNDIVRFWRKVDKTETCWNWRGAAHSPKAPYGSFYVISNGIGHRLKTHRISWFLAHGEIADGMDVCHKCDNHKCVRPDHLFLGTAKDNIRDALFKLRLKTKLYPNDVEQIVALKKSGKTYEEIGEIFKVALSVIWNICNGHSWEHVTGISRREKGLGKIKLARTLYDEVRKKVRSGMPQTIVAAEYGVSNSLICSILVGSRKNIENNLCSV